MVTGLYTEATEIYERRGVGVRWKQPQGSADVFLD